MMEKSLLLKIFSDRCQKFGYYDFLRDYSNKVVPECIDYETLVNYDWNDGDYKINPFYGDPFKNIDGFSRFDCRDLAIKLCGFSLVNKITAKELASYIGNRKCLEIMAGTGSWSKALSDEGVNIIATDLKIDHAIEYNNSWMEVEKIDCVEAIKKYKPDIVLCSWPRANSPIINATEEILQNSSGELIYIGEGSEGCCAGEDFFDQYYQDIESLDINLPRWEGIYDSISSIKNPKM